MRKRTTAKGSAAPKRTSIQKDDSGARAPQHGKVVASAFAAFLLAVLVYSNSLDGDFVFDDTRAVVQNPDVLGQRPLAAVFAHDFWGKNLADPTSHKTWRPLTTLTFRLNRQSAGADGSAISTWGFHATNVILHAIVSGLVVCMSADMLFGGRWRPALLAGALFAVHPVHVEAVSSIVGRTEVLSALFFLSATICYKRSVGASGDDASNPTPTRGAMSNLAPALWLLLCAICSTFAMLSKEQGITVIGVLFVFELSKQVRKVHTTRLLTLIVTLAALLKWRLSLLSGEAPEPALTQNPAMHLQSRAAQVMTVAHTTALHAWLLIFPRKLCCDWSHDAIPVVVDVADARNIFTVLFICGVAVLGFRCLRDLVSGSGALALAGALLSVPFIPSSNIFFPVGFTVAERVLYTPSIGFCVLVALVCDEVGALGQAQIASKDKGDARKGAVASRPILRVALFCYIVVALTLGGGRTLFRNRDWANSMTLFKSLHDELPGTVRASMLYGPQLLEEGEQAKAIAVMKSGLAAEARSHMHLQSMNKMVLRMKLAAVIHEQHKPNNGYNKGNTEAAELYRKSIIEDKENGRGTITDATVRSHYTLAGLALQEGAAEAAVSHMFESLSVDPRPAASRVMLAIALAMQAQLNDAKKTILSVNKGKGVKIVVPKGTLHLDSVRIDKRDSELLMKTWKWLTAADTAPKQAPKDIVDGAKPLFERFFVGLVN